MVRLHTSVLAGAEKRLLVRIAGRLPAWMNSDHLTFAGAAAMVGVGGSFWVGGPALGLVIPLLALNWLGDSLDGTLARVRHQERPRYGYYVDHVLDAIGFGSLMLGLVLGRHMTLGIGLGFLAAYYLLLVEIALATHARGTFRMSFGWMGPSEMRVVLAAGTLMLMLRPETVAFLGQRWRLFDVGGAVGIAGLISTFVTLAITNGVALYREEPVP
jgi:phosphatidylglycerophosphate synthase